MPYRARPVQSVAAVLAPIFVPARGMAAAQHGARQVARARRRAKGRGPASPGAASRHAGHRRPANNYVTSAVPALRLADQLRESVASGDRASVGTGVASAAAAIHLARRDARQADVGSLGAPDRPIAIPHRGWGASEGLAGRNDGREKEQDRHGVPLTKVPTGSKSLTGDRTAARSAQQTRPWRGPRRAACARACGPAAVRQGEQAKCAARPKEKSAPPGDACRRQSAPIGCRAHSGAASKAHFNACDG